MLASFVVSVMAVRDWMSSPAEGGLRAAMNDKPWRVRTQLARWV